MKSARFELTTHPLLVRTFYQLDYKVTTRPRLHNNRRENGDTMTLTLILSPTTGVLASNTAWSITIASKLGQVVNTIVFFGG